MVVDAKGGQQGPQIEGSNIGAAIGAYTEMQARFTDHSLRRDLDGIAIGASGIGSWYVGIRLSRRLTVEEMTTLSEGVDPPVRFYGPNGRIFPPVLQSEEKTLILPALAQVTPGRVE